MAGGIVVPAAHNTGGGGCSCAAPPAGRLPRNSVWARAAPSPLCADVLGHYNSSSIDDHQYLLGCTVGCVRPLLSSLLLSTFVSRPLARPLCSRRRRLVGFVKCNSKLLIGGAQSRRFEAKMSGRIDEVNQSAPRALWLATSQLFPLVARACVRVAPQWPPSVMSSMMLSSRPSSHSVPCNHFAPFHGLSHHPFFCLRVQPGQTTTTAAAAAAAATTTTTTTATTTTTKPKSS
jgi:hypothetical protein